MGAAYAKGAEKRHVPILAWHAGRCDQDGTSSPTRFADAKAAEQVWVDTILARTTPFNSDTVLVLCSAVVEEDSSMRAGVGGWSGRGSIAQATLLEPHRR